MKKKIYVLFCILFLINDPAVIALNEAPNQMAEVIKKTNQPLLDQLLKQSIVYDDIQDIKVENNSGLQRAFSIHDGFQERVLRKVVYWLNNVDQVKGSIEESLDRPSNKLTVNMANGEVITIEPAYTCVVDNKLRTCTAKEGELIVSENSEKVRVKSQPLYDWLMVEWRKEVNGPTKEELLEEALYTRYLYQLGPSYAEFFDCPKITIEPIDGDPRRHLIFGSALTSF
ncbi:MAG: hypothetical protein RR440_07035, partial [Erysipelotrichaceae bacterium]